MTREEWYLWLKDIELEVRTKRRMAKLMQEVCREQPEPMKPKPKAEPGEF